MELRPKVRRYTVPCVAALAADKLRYGERFVLFALVFEYALGVGGEVEARDDDALFVGAPFVVLALDFEESEMAVHVLAHAYFLPY